MQRKATYQWLLRDVMADHGLFATTTLVPLLAERGIVLSPSQVHRLVTQEPERLSLPILAALCDIFDCTPTVLIHTAAATTAERKAAAGEPKVIDRSSPLRPKRARLRPEP